MLKRKATTELYLKKDKSSHLTALRFYQLVLVIEAIVGGPVPVGATLIPQNLVHCFQAGVVVQDILQQHSAGVIQ